MRRVRWTLRTGLIYVSPLRGDYAPTALVTYDIWPLVLKIRSNDYATAPFFVFWLTNVAHDQWSCAQDGIVVIMQSNWLADGIVSPLSLLSFEYYIKQATVPFISEKGRRVRCGPENGT